MSPVSSGHLHNTPSPTRFHGKGRFTNALAQHSWSSALATSKTPQLKQGCLRLTWMPFITIEAKSHWRKLQSYMLKCKASSPHKKTWYHSHDGSTFETCLMLWISSCSMSCLWYWNLHFYTFSLHFCFTGCKHGWAKLQRIYKKPYKVYPKNKNSLQ